MRLLWPGAAIALAAGAWLAGADPLLEVPGWELGALVALLFALLLGPALGLAAARAALAGDAPPLRAFVRAALWALALCAAPFLAAAGRAALGPCAPLHGAALYALTAPPSALLATALGLLTGLVAQGRARRAAGLYALVLLGSAAWTLSTAWFGPSAFAHDHLLGFWPGPIYDEVLRADATLAGFRGATLLFTGAAVAVACRRALPALALAAAAVALHAAAIPTRADVVHALGGERDGPHCTLFHPAELAAADVDRLEAQCEGAVVEVAAALGIAAPPRVTVFLHRDPESKRRLVGAGHTSYTKPWLSEIHVHAAGVPHPLLRHEVVHAVAAAAAPPPLHVPARLRILPAGGLIEGLAMALDRPAADLHARARVLRDLGHLPPAAVLLGEAGFFTAAPARAYVAAGSFARFLLDRAGPEPLRALYGHGDFAGAYGVPVEALEAEWRGLLDGVEVPPKLRADAEARFRDPGLFGRRCPRETAED